MKNAALLGAAGSAVLLSTVLSYAANAAPVEVRVTVQSLVAENDITFAPLRLGFHNGSYDAFNNGEGASDAIISIAEGGSGDAWFPAFAAADPTATLGTVADGGPLLPGASASVTFMVDPSINRYFTFASMVVPSNDHFIGNDNPLAYELFDAEGNLLIDQIGQTGDQIWDAGSEVTDPANAAFLVGGVNAQRTNEGGVVSFDFSELDAYNGLETAAGYTFERQFAGGDEIYRISFEIVPSPGAAGLLGLAGVVAVRRRR